VRGGEKKTRFISPSRKGGDGERKRPEFFPCLKQLWRGGRGCLFSLTVPGRLVFSNHKKGWDGGISLPLGGKRSRETETLVWTKEEKKRGSSPRVLRARRKGEMRAPPREEKKKGKRKRKVIELSFIPGGKKEKEIYFQSSKREKWGGKKANFLPRKKRVLPSCSERGEKKESALPYRGGGNQVPLIPHLKEKQLERKGGVGLARLFQKGGKEGGHGGPPLDKGGKRFGRRFLQAPNRSKKIAKR